MVHCMNCHYKWKTSNTLKLFISRNGVNCPQCNKTQYMSLQTQKLLFTFGYLSLFFIPFLLYRTKLSNKDKRIFQS